MPRDDVARSRVGQLEGEMARSHKARMVALQNVEAMLLTQIRNLQESRVSTLKILADVEERVKKLEGLQWTPEEVLGVPISNASTRSIASEQKEEVLDESSDS